MSSLETVFGELGISQYLEAFIEQGFDTWETILDITESDLDALAVKLGHRRKLQRRIANDRALVPAPSLVPSTQAGSEDVSATAGKSAQSESRDNTTTSKRRYRRHPKPDENAPERPPSAYVLFSNKMREDLKGQNLSFTEIAKLVGENWQNLMRTEKEPYESQAQEAKEKYNRSMTAYKSTDEFQKYNDYLQDFRKRQAAQFEEKDVVKRIKRGPDSSSNRGSSSSVTPSGSSGSNSTTGSGSDSQPGSEPPPSRQQRLGSIASPFDHRISPVLPSITNQPCAAELTHSPGYFKHDDDLGSRCKDLSSPTARDLPSHCPRRQSSLQEAIRPETITTFGQPTLGLNDLQSSRVTSTSHSSEGGLPGIAPPPRHRGSLHSGLGIPQYWPAASPLPSLSTESSTDSISSRHSSSYSSTRNPTESSLPIHALLSIEPTPCAPQPLVVPSTIAEPGINHSPPSTHLSHNSMPSPIDGRTQFTMTRPSIGVLQQALPVPPMNSAMATAFSPPASNQLPPIKSLPTPIEQFDGRFIPGTASRPGKPGDAILDGMSALLRASDIVDRQKQF